MTTTRRWVRRALIVSSAVVTALAVTTPAQADPFGLDTPTHSEPGVGGIPDNFTQWYCFSGAGWTAGWQTVVNSRMINLDTQTSYTDGLDTSCDSLTDVWFILDSTIGSTTRGSYVCNAWNTGDDGVANTGDEECERSTVRLNPTLLPDDHQRRKTACHEIGHSVGLAHGTNTATFWNDCMVSGAVAAGNQWEQYNAHHIAHANSRTPAAS